MALFTRSSEPFQNERILELLFIVLTGSPFFSKRISFESILNAYVNLIPYNETSHIEYKKSDQDTILKFYDVLKKNNIGVTIRREFGGNISAACGQLRSKKEEL